MQTKQQSSSSGDFPQRGIITDLTDRGIRKDTAEFFGIETLFENDTPIGRSYPIFDFSNNFAAQKLKPLDKTKKMKWLGSKDKLGLFGMNKYPYGGKYVTITEGEEDAAAVWQMLKDANPAFTPVVVSIKNGASSAERDCQLAYEFLDSYENIIIAFDGDEPGRKAAEKVAQLFPLKCRIMKFSDAVQDPETKEWSLKDGNDYLKANKQKEFIDKWYKAERYVPKGVLTMRSLWDSMTLKDHNIVVSYPWDGLDKMLHGMRTGEMLVIKAPPKIGKTQVCRELAYHVRSTSEHNVGLVFLEDTKKSIGLGMCALHVNKPIQVPDIPYSMDELRKAHEYLSEDERIMVFDPEDDRTVDNIFRKIKYFVKAHDCKYIILDHASMLAYQSESLDERKFLDKLFADLKALTTSLNIWLGVVVHVNDDGKTRGSRAPVQLCNALIALERNKLSEDERERNTTTIVVEENRISGESGIACKLFYDKDTGRLIELDSEFLEEQQKQVKIDDLF